MTAAAEAAALRRELVEVVAQADAHAKRAREYRAPGHQATVQPVLALASEVRALRLTIVLATKGEL